MVFTATIVAIVLLVAGVLIMEAPALYDGCTLDRWRTRSCLFLARWILGTTEKNEHEGPLSEEEVMSMAIYPMAIPLLLNPVGI